MKLSIMTRPNTTHNNATTISSFGLRRERQFLLFNIYSKWLLCLFFILVCGTTPTFITSSSSIQFTTNTTTSTTTTPIIQATTTIDSLNDNTSKNTIHIRRLEQHQHHQQEQQPYSQSNANYVVAFVVEEEVKEEKQQRSSVQFSGCYHDHILCHHEHTAVHKNMRKLSLTNVPMETSVEKESVIPSVIPSMVPTTTTTSLISFSMVPSIAPSTTTLPTQFNSSSNNSSSTTTNSTTTTTDMKTSGSKAAPTWIMMIVVAVIVLWLITIFILIMTMHEKKVIEKELQAYVSYIGNLRGPGTMISQHLKDDAPTNDDHENHSKEVIGHIHNNAFSKHAIKKNNNNDNIKDNSTTVDTEEKVGTNLDGSDDNGCSAISLENKDVPLNDSDVKILYSPPKKDYSDPKQHPTLHIDQIYHHLFCKDSNDLFAIKWHEMNPYHDDNNNNSNNNSNKTMSERQQQQKGFYSNPKSYDQANMASFTSTTVSQTASSNSLNTLHEQQQPTMLSTINTANTSVPCCSTTKEEQPAIMLLPLSSSAITSEGSVEKTTVVTKCCYNASPLIHENTDTDSLFTKKKKKQRSFLHQTGALISKQLCHREDSSIENNGFKTTGRNSPIEITPNLSEVFNEMDGTTKYSENIYIPNEGMNMTSIRSDEVSTVHSFYEEETGMDYCIEKKKNLNEDIMIVPEDFYYINDSSTIDSISLLTTMHPSEFVSNLDVIVMDTMEMRHSKNQNHNDPTNNDLHGEYQNVVNDYVDDSMERIHPSSMDNCMLEQIFIRRCSSTSSHGIEFSTSSCCSSNGNDKLNEVSDTDHDYKEVARRWHNNKKIHNGNETVQEKQQIKLDSDHGKIEVVSHNYDCDLEVECEQQLVQQCFDVMERAFHTNPRTTTTKVSDISIPMGMDSSLDDDNHYGHRDLVVRMIVVSSYLPTKLHLSVFNTEYGFIVSRIHRESPFYNYFYPGDIIIAIDGYNTKGMSTQDFQFHMMSHHHPTTISTNNEIDNDKTPKYEKKIIVVTDQKIRLEV